MERIFTRLFASLVLLPCLTAPAPVLACTVFHAVSENVRLVAQNYDWEADQGMLLFNPRGLQKRSFSDPNRKQWTSRHASITVNQYGREFPIAGMNEQGLVIAVAWMDDTVLPRGDSRPTVNFLQWTQYQLDRHATVAEVAASVHEVGIADFFFAGRIHYMIADREGNRAVLAHLGGRPILYMDDAAAHPALGNERYDRLNVLQQVGDEGFGRRGEWPGASPRRFLRAGDHASRTVRSTNPIQTAFSGLSDLRQDEYSKWSIVYDQREGRIVFQTRRSQGFRTINFADFDLAVGATPALMLDINAPISGNIRKEMIPWTPALNARFANEAFDAIDLTALIPRFARNRVINWGHEGVSEPVLNPAR